MENIIKNPGLQHLAEKVFWNLNYEEIVKCELINQKCYSILNNPLFWLGKFIQKGMSKKNQNEWMNAIRMTKDTDFEKYVLLYLKRCGSKNKRVVDLHCFIDEEFLSKCAKMIQWNWIDDMFSDKPNALNKYDPEHKFFRAANRGDVDFFKMFAFFEISSYY